MRFLCVLLTLAPISLGAGDEPAPLVLAGPAGARTVPAPLFRATLARGLEHVRGATLPALRKAAPERKRNAWNVDTVGVGVGLSGELGLGPVLNLTVESSLQLMFTRSDKPEYPKR